MANKSIQKHDLSQLLKAVPSKSGVYRMRDDFGSILYVGKAGNLRNRLRSYFVKKNRLEPKIRTMVGQVTDFDFILTESDEEAVFLECNLIKEHKPPYNSRLKDDKSYPFIKIDMSEDFPRVYITRAINNDGSLYFGPYASASSVRSTLALLKKLFPYRSCTKSITGTSQRPCLDYHINRCVGPCIGVADKSEYGKVIEQVTLFLSGKTEKVAKQVLRQMREAADKQEFERAAVLRDQFKAIDKVKAGQKVLNLSQESMDVIGLAIEDDEAWIEVFFIREGKLIGRDNFIMTGTSEKDPGKILTTFIEQFYSANPFVPARILTQHSPLDPEALNLWLGSKRKGRVSVYMPRRGEKRKLVQMVEENAVEGLEQLRVRQVARGETEAGIVELQEALSLPRPPRRIECYDISNIQGSSPVGSMIVFEDGKPKTSNYRRFKIKAVDGIDDYSMMREVLTRRFKRAGNMIEAELRDKKQDGSDVDAWETVPDLVLIDGGKGHLGAALQVFLELGIQTIPLASLAKQKEEIFVPESPDSIILPRNSKALFLVQRARNEAHRFAITFHRKSRSKKSVSSVLDSVPGIGSKRRRVLLRKFGSVKGIKDASIEELAAAPSMNHKLADRLKEHL